MKYAYIGTHGVGKSAAAHFLAAKLKRAHPELSIKVIEESAREISKISGINNSQFQKMAILDSLYKQELYMPLYDVIICDRTPFDYLIYSKVFGVQLDSTYEQLAIDNLKIFDHIYFIRPDGTPLANDGFRLTNEREQIKLDKVFMFHLDINKIQHEVIRTTEVYK